MRTIRSLLATFALVAAFAASAAPITFIYTGAGSGTLNGVAFSNAVFTITATGDTEDITPSMYVNGFFIPHLGAQVEIEGVGVLTFLTGTRTFVSNDAEFVAFSRTGVGGDLYHGPTDAAFAAWDMTTSIGELAGTTRLLQWTTSPVQTSGGVLEFADTQTRGTFEAIVGTTQQAPEPGSLVLMAAALMALGLAARRRTH